MKSKSKQKKAGESQAGAVPAGDETQQAAPDQFRPDKKPLLLRWLLIIIIILILVLAGLFGWLWWRDRGSDNTSGNTDSSATEESEPGTEEEASAAFCAEGLTHYQNAGLGLQFCYPEAWGTVAVSDARFDPSDTGTRQNLSFSGKAAVNLGVASADWETSLGRDGVCNDPASPFLPPFTPFSTSWNVLDDGAGANADRGIEKMDGQYLIQEFASNTLAETVCLTGYTVLDGTPFTHTTGSYATTFTAAVPAPADHVASPNVLISAAERNEFYAFVKSVEDL